MHVSTASVMNVPDAADHNWQDFASMDYKLMDESSCIIRAMSLPLTTSVIGIIFKLQIWYRSIPLDVIKLGLGWPNFRQWIVYTARCHSLIHLAFSVNKNNTKAAKEFGDTEMCNQLWWIIYEQTMQWQKKRDNDTNMHFIFLWYNIETAPKF
jgi:hypothetical protein